MPLTDNEKLRAFESKVIGAANEHASHITTVAHEQKEAALALRREQIDARVRAKYHTMYESERERIAADASLAALERRGEYLRLYDEIADRLIARLTERLQAFVEGEEYGAYLTDLCRRAAQTIPGDFTVALCPRDHERFADDCRTAAGERCMEVVADPSVGIGGALFCARTGGMAINQTFAESLSRAGEKLAALMGNDLRVDL